MKITLYTISDCQFSKQEKEYLTGHSLQYEEKNLEANKDFLTEMLAISNNFAGTPVTRVEKDDGSIAVLKGFTKEEFDTTFGFVAAPTDTQPPVTNPSASSGQTNETPIATEMLPKVEDVKPATEPVPPVDISPTSAAIPADTQPPVTTNELPVPTPPDLSADLSSKVSTTEEASAKTDPLKSVMDDLQSKSLPTTEPLPPSAPTIPDFPAK